MTVKILWRSQGGMGGVKATMQDTWWRLG